MPGTEVVKIIVVGRRYAAVRGTARGYVRLNLRSATAVEAPVAVRLRKARAPEARSAWATAVDYRAFGGHLYEPVPERPYRREHVLSRLLLDDLGLPRPAVRLFEDQTDFIEQSVEWGPVAHRDRPVPSKEAWSNDRWWPDLTETELGRSYLGREDMLLVVDGVVHVRSLGPVSCRSRNPSLTQEPVLGPVEWMTSAEALADSALRAGICRFDRVTETGGQDEVEVLPALAGVVLADEVPVVLDAMAALAFETFGRLRLSEIPRGGLEALRTCAAAIRATHGKEPAELESGPMSANPSIFSAFRAINVDGVREAIADILDAFVDADLNRSCRAAYDILDTYSRSPHLEIDRSPGRRMDIDDLEAIGMAVGFAP